MFVVDVSRMKSDTCKLYARSRCRDADSYVIPGHTTSEVSQVTVLLNSWAMLPLLQVM